MLLCYIYRLAALVCRDARPATQPFDLRRESVGRSVEGGPAGIPRRYFPHGLLGPLRGHNVALFRSIPLANNNRYLTSVASVIYAVFVFTVAMLSQKGGAGKTTLACGLAVESERAGLATVVVDLDPQASAAKWADLRKASTPVVTSAQPARLTPVLTAAQDAGARVALIDTAPHAADAALMAARAADLVLIPCRPSAADLHAIGGTIDLTRIAETRAVVVINSAPVNNPVVEQAQVAIAGYHIEAAPFVVHHRIDHVHAFTAGLAATEWAPRRQGRRGTHGARRVDSPCRSNPRLIWQLLCTVRPRRRNLNVCPLERGRSQACGESPVKARRESSSTWSRSSGVSFAALPSTKTQRCRRLASKLLGV